MKGKTNNPNGRPKGSANRVTTEMRQWIRNLIESRKDLLKADFEMLDAAERWRLTEKLIQYIMPKMQHLNANISVEDLTEEQINDIIEDLHSKIA